MRLVSLAAFAVAVLFLLSGDVATGSVPSIRPVAAHAKAQAEPVPVKKRVLQFGVKVDWLKTGMILNGQKDANGNLCHVVVVGGAWSAPLAGTSFFCDIYNENTAAFVAGEVITSSANNQTGAVISTMLIPVTSAWGMQITADPSGSPEVFFVIYGADPTPKAVSTDAWVDKP